MEPSPSRPSTPEPARSPPPTAHPAPSRRRRAALALAAVVVLALGLAIRLVLEGPWTGPAGDVLYAVLVYLVIAFALPHLSPVSVDVVAVAVCVAVELFQLTGLPAAWGQAFPPVRLLLGTTFTAADLPLYALGGAVAAAVDAAVRRLSRRGAPRGPRAPRATPRGGH